MPGSDDGWGADYDDQTYVTAYDQLEMALLEPLDRQLETADVEQFRPKFKNQRNPREQTKKNKNDDDWRDAIYNLQSSEESDDDHEQRKHYFQPPLQVQRNNFVRNVLKKFRNDTDTPITRLAVMGCGEMSLERAICDSFGAIGTTNVMSVDIDPESVSVGQQLLQKHLNHQSDILASEKGLPVLMRSFVGDILQPDHRFADVDAIVSLEVVEHIPLADAKTFVDMVLGVLMPRIFVFSTPNHEYNTVFGMKPGEFRHDDHKFEMARAQFADWLYELSVRFPHYTIDRPKFIGMTDGYESLSGASQAAVCRLNADLNTPLPQNTTPYQLVGQIPCRLGTRITAYNLVRQAFLEWIEKTEFHEAELKTDSFSPYWKYDLRHVLHHLHAPISFASTIDERVVIKYIQGMTSNKVVGDVGTDGGNAIVIMQIYRKQDIIKIVEQNAI